MCKLLKSGVMGSILGLSNLSDETLNRGPMTIFKDKLLTMTYCDEAEDYAVPKEPTTHQPLYNTVCYNTILDITRFNNGSQKCIDYIEK